MSVKLKGVIVDERTDWLTGDDFGVVQLVFGHEVIYSTKELTLPYGSYAEHREFFIAETLAPVLRRLFADNNDNN